MSDIKCDNHSLIATISCAAAETSRKMLTNAMIFLYRWVLNTLDKMALKNPPTLVLLPLGTGNDLARSIGYGSGEDASLIVQNYLQKLNLGTVTSLDRWHIKVNPYRHFGIQLPSHDFYMQNYISIGVDALVTYNFHKARESPFYLISSRIINKLIYFR